MTNKVHFVSFDGVDAGSIVYDDTGVVEVTNPKLGGIVLKDRLIFTRRSRSDDKIGDSHKKLAAGSLENVMDFIDYSLSYGFKPKE
jgi:hypothetical protein